MDYAENVARGIALLDEKGPPDWRERINLDILDLDNIEHCVLGQVYGGSAFSGYTMGCEALGILSPYGGGRTGQAFLLGFIPVFDEDFDGLAAAWKTALGGGGSHAE